MLWWSVLLIIPIYFFARAWHCRRLAQEIIRDYEVRMKMHHPEYRVNPESHSNRSELWVDGLENIGTVCLNFIFLDQAKSFLSSTSQWDASGSVQEDIVFQALSRRYSELNPQEIIAKFNHHLIHNETLLKGDVGEEIGARLRESEGMVVEFPTTLDGSWKSNQEGHDYVAQDGDLFIKENPKVGYEGNFSKIKEQAEQNPDVRYLVGSEHAKSVESAGLDNITVQPELSEANVENVINGFATKIGEVNSDTLTELDLFDWPLFTIAAIGANQYRLMQSGDINVGEATLNTAAKAGVKFGTASGAGLAGQALGLMVGGPVGAIIGGALCGMAGSAFGTGLYTAWKSSEVVKIYLQQNRLLQDICTTTVEDLNLKKKQSDQVSMSLRQWKKRNIWKIIWPDREYVLNHVTSKAAFDHVAKIELCKRSITQSFSELRASEKIFSEMGFFGRLLGTMKEEEVKFSKIAKIVFMDVASVGVIRVNKLENNIERWKNKIDEVAKVKRKIAA